MGDEFDPNMVGSTIEQFSLSTLLRDLAMGVAQAQRDLDDASIETAVKLMSNTLTITDAGGNLHSKSLLELGFLPTFYHFQSATINVSVTVSMQVQEETSMGFGLGVELGYSSTTTGKVPPKGGKTGPKKPDPKPGPTPP